MSSDLAQPAEPSQLLSPPRALPVSVAQPSLQISRVLPSPPDSGRQVAQTCYQQHHRSESHQARPPRIESIRSCPCEKKGWADPACPPPKGPSWRHGLGVKASRQAGHPASPTSRHKPRFSAGCAKCVGDKRQIDNMEAFAQRFWVSSRGSSFCPVSPSGQPGEMMPALFPTRPGDVAVQQGAVEMVHSALVHLGKGKPRVKYPSSLAKNLPSHACRHGDLVDSASVLRRRHHP